MMRSPPRASIPFGAALLAGFATTAVTVSAEVSADKLDPAALERRLEQTELSGTGP